MWALSHQEEQPPPEPQDAPVEPDWIEKEVGDPGEPPVEDSVIPLEWLEEGEEK